MSSVLTEEILNLCDGHELHEVKAALKHACAAFSVQLKGAHLDAERTETFEADSGRMSLAEIFGG